ncbi:MAG: hypothetical protein QXD03_03925 [Candidatus Anstonellales archaeon]
MERVRVKDIYVYDTISRNNDKAWELISEAIKDKGEVVLDFYGIELLEPWGNDVFKQMVVRYPIKMVVYNNKNLCDSLNALGYLLSKSYNICENVVIEAPKVLSPAEKKIEMVANQLKGYIEACNGGCVLHVNRRFSQLESLESLKYIKRAIEMLNNEIGVNNLILQLRGMLIQDSVIQGFVGMVNEMGNVGINIVLDMDDVVANKYKLFRDKYLNESLTLKDKLDILKNNLVPGMIGVIERYAKTRGKDSFGRYGGGNAIYRKVAIFRGFVQSGSNIKLVFDTFENSTFYTKEHWMIENDGEELGKINIKKVEVAISELGYDSVGLIGSLYNLYDLNKFYDVMVDVYRVNNLGYSEKLVVPLPVKIKMVLDDWGVKYNVELLERHVNEALRVNGYKI